MEFHIGPTPNFITEIFFLASAISHYGLNRTLQTYDDLHKEMEDVQRHIDFLNSSLSSLRPGVSEKRQNSIMAADACA